MSRQLGSIGYLLWQQDLVPFLSKSSYTQNSVSKQVIDKLLKQKIRKRSESYFVIFVRTCLNTLSSRIFQKLTESRDIHLCMHFFICGIDSTASISSRIFFSQIFDEKHDGRITWLLLSVDSKKVVPTLIINLRKVSV